MLISELLRRKRASLSCELFPPKKTEEMPNAFENVERTAALAPDFISVTCSVRSAGNNVRLAEHIRACNALPLAHLTCTAVSKGEVDALLDRLALGRISNILALRGDLPEDMTDAPRAYTYANELVARIKARGGFCVGAACYPEGHVESANQAQDIANLKRKVDAGTDFLITQMFFDNDVLYRFLYKAMAAGIDVPVLAGIMPVTNKNQIARTLKLSGTTLPPRFLNFVDKFGDNPVAMRQAGIAYATEQIVDLIANGVRGVHIYTMNHPDVAAEIIRNVSSVVDASCAEEQRAVSNAC